MKNLFVLFISIFLVGCAPKFNAYKAPQDNFSPGVEHFFSGDIEFQENTFGGPGLGNFKFNTYKKSDILKWSLTTHWISASSNWLFVNTIAFNIDGKIFTFNSLPNPLRQVFALGVREVNDFNVSSEFINKLSKSNSIIVRVSGTNFYAERTLTIEDINNIKWYISYIHQNGNVPH